MTPRQANVLTVVGLVALLIAVSLTAPRWAALLREPLTVFEGDEADPDASPPPPNGAEGTAARRIGVRLYFEAPDGSGLLSEEREIAFSDDLTAQLQTLVEELVRGPKSGLLPTLPAQTRVLGVFVTPRGVAYVNLSGEATGVPGGSRSELLTVYSVVNSLVVNFPAVSRVQLLVEDRMVSSFSGHVDLSRPLPADLTLVALSTPQDPSPDPGPPARAGTTPGESDP
jgi:hypothetical protein